MAFTAYSSAENTRDKGISQPGKNCWRIERARRFSLLIDAQAYFSAVRKAIVTARHSVFILSWDIDSRVWLVPQGAGDGYPESLGEFLEAIAKERPQLRIHILNWDFAMLYALEREWLPSMKFGSSADRRLAFSLDGRHPPGASHHQKVVVVDDAVAFVGGLDLTRSRWDTPDHAADNPLRCDPDGKPHAPFHDVQAVVDGDVARALGELARMRWRRAVGYDASVPQPVDADPWPSEVEPDLHDVDVAIARTEPAFEGEEGVFEVRQLHLDAIAAARRRLFFENQYFTSSLIADALARRLEEPSGPEVMVVSPHTQSGWLEQATMGVLRSRVHRRLMSSDTQGRYGMYCPSVPGLEDRCLNVHSKIFAVDDALFGVGSANLSSRSMYLDTECHLAVEACGPEAYRSRVSEAIASWRNRLLAEHLGSAEEAVLKEIRAHGGSLHGAARSLSREEGRTLRRHDPPAYEELDALLPDSKLIDPQEPIDTDYVVSQLLPQDARRNTPRRLAALGLLTVTMAVLAVVWHWTPLREWVNLASLVSLARGLEDMPFTPLAVMICYAVAGMLLVPLTLLIAVTGIVFGPLMGGLYAVSGALLSAALSYGIGSWLGREAVRRLVGPRINRLSQRIARQGILAMMLVRFLPIAPFTVVNVVAGASHIRFRDYLIGTLLGLLPGVMVIVNFAHHLAEAIRSPNPRTVSALLAMVALLILLAVGLQRLVTRREGKGAR